MLVYNARLAIILFSIFSIREGGSMKRNLCIGLLFVVVLALLLAASSILQKRAAVEAAGVQGPRFEVDPLWPKPLPHPLLFGPTNGGSGGGKTHHSLDPHAGAP